MIDIEKPHDKSAPYYKRCMEFPFRYLSDMSKCGNPETELNLSNGLRKLVSHAYFYSACHRLIPLNASDINYMNSKFKSEPLTEQPRTKKFHREVLYDLIQSIIHSRFQQKKDRILPQEDNVGKEFLEFMNITKNSAVKIEVIDYDPLILRKVNNGKLTINIWSKVLKTDIDYHQLKEEKIKFADKTSIFVISSDKYTPWWLDEDVPDPDELYIASPNYVFAGCATLGIPYVPEPTDSWVALSHKALEPNTDSTQPEHGNGNVEPENVEPENVEPGNAKNSTIEPGLNDQ